MKSLNLKASSIDMRPVRRTYTGSWKQRALRSGNLISIGKK